MKFTYNDRINIISEFFGVSYNCSKYMYHRCRKGDIHKKKENEEFLDWSIQLQNGLVSGDLLNIDYKNLSFKNDIIDLKEIYSIDITKMPNDKIIQNKIMQTEFKKNKIKDSEILDHDDENEWRIITSKKTLHDKKKILKQMGFYISSYNIKNDI